MRYLKGFAISMLLTLLLGVTSCGHLPKDKFPNPATQGYHRMEFDIGKAGVVKKEIGIGNIYLTEEQDLSKVFFKIYGLYTGTLYMKSAACGIDFSSRFDGITTFKLSDLIPFPAKCSIKITAETDAIENREHNIVESGVIKLNVISEDSKTVSFEYTRTSSQVRSTYKTYAHTGQGSIQRQAGDLTSYEKFKVKTDLTQGGYYRVSGCGYVTSGKFDVGSFEVSFKELYGKTNLEREDTCDFEIIVIPNEVLESYQGRFSVNIYGKEVVKLEALERKIKKSWGRKKLYVWGGDLILACAINNKVKTKKKNFKLKCDTKYESSGTYWIRSITTNARKSIYAVKNNVVIWKE